jgi:hypothetical protein
MKNYLVSAIKLLRPTAEFVFTNEDYSTIQWHILEGTAPTQAEIDAEIEKIKTQEIADQAAKAHERAALLERLGITENEARLLLGGN